ncbi:MAG TPA: histidine kinase [Chitinophagales bacterium]|nr:histidine kinase [Chitinophagales bacterium]
MTKVSWYKQQWLLHVVFWMAYLVLLTMVFARFLPLEQALLRNTITGLVLAPMVYLNLYVFVPNLLFTKRFSAYAGSILILLLISSPLRAWLDQRFAFNAYNPLVLNSPAHYATIVFSSLVMLAVTTTLRLFQDWYAKTQLAINYERLQLEAELRFLKAQINPHFLFNTLNNIYTLTYLEGKTAAPHILQLSGLMRYMLYESDEHLVPLSKELGYIQDYLQLQQLKNGKTDRVLWDVEGVSDGILIAPLILIPFIENAFKHGNALDNTSGYIHGKLKAENDTLIFHLENSIDAAATKKDAVGGVGLENVRKRLQILYPNKHMLNISGTQDTFTVQLTLRLI